jgi:hypothetical protein
MPVNTTTPSPICMACTVCDPDLATAPRLPAPEIITASMPIAVRPMTCANGRNTQNHWRAALIEDHEDLRETVNCKGLNGPG